MRKKITQIMPKSQTLTDLKISGYGHLSRYTHHDATIGLDEIALLGYFNAYAGNKGECWPSRDHTILKELAWGRVKYDNALRTLKKAGYVSTKRTIRQGSPVYLYTLLEPEAAKRKQTKIKEKDPDHPKYTGLDRHGFGFVYKALATAEYLSGGAKGLLFYLLSRMGHTGETRLNYAIIKDQLNIKSDRTVHTYLQELICVGLIRTEKIRKSGQFHKIRFIFTPAYNEIHPTAVSFFADQPSDKKTTIKKAVGKKQADNKTSSPVEDKPLPSVDVSLDSSLAKVSISIGSSQSINGAARQTCSKISRIDFWTYQPQNGDNSQNILDWQETIPKRISTQLQALRDWQTAMQVISSQTGIATVDTAAMTRCIDYDIFYIISNKRTIPIDLVQDPQVTRRVVRVLTGYHRNNDILYEPAKRELAIAIEDALTRILNESKAEDFLPRFSDVLFGRKTKATNVMLRLFYHLYANMTGRQDIKRIAAYVKHSVVNFFKEYDTPWSEIPYKKDITDNDDTPPIAEESLPERYNEFIRTKRMEKYQTNILLLPVNEFNERAAAYEALSHDERTDIFTSSELDWIWYVLPSDYGSFVSEHLNEDDQQAIKSLSTKEYKRCKKAYEAMTAAERCDIWDGDHDWLLGDTGTDRNEFREAI